MDLRRSPLYDDMNSSINRIFPTMKDFLFPSVYVIFGSRARRSVLELLDLLHLHILGDRDLRDERLLMFTPFF